MKEMARLEKAFPPGLEWRLAFDNVGVVRVEWYFDGGLSATTTTAPFSYTLNLTPVAGSPRRRR